MTTERKLLLGGGILLLFLFHIVAAFALGVYVGRYGLTREGLTLQGPARNQGPAQPEPRQGAPDQPGGPALPGEPAVVGRIHRLDGRTLDLATLEGPRQVMLDGETRYRDRAGELLDREDLAEGQIVAVFGIYADDGRQLHADLVVVLPAQELGADQPGQADRP
jgi:hypothetical protein